MSAIFAPITAGQTVAPAAEKVRVELAAPGTDPATAASIWATAVRDPDGSVAVTPVHPHPDLLPAVGWLVAGLGGPHVVAAVDGRTLTCRSAP